MPDQMPSGWQPAGNTPQQPQPQAQQQPAAPKGWTVAPQQGQQQAATPVEQKNLTALPSLQTQVQTTADNYADKFKIPRGVLRTMAALETGGQTDPETTINASGHKGVYQFDDPSFGQYEPHGNILKMTDNTEAAAKYMNVLHDQYHGNWVLAAGAFNMGPGNFDRYLKGDTKGMPASKIAETNRYMAYVAANVNKYDQPVPPDHNNKNFQATTRAKQQQMSNLDPTKAKHDIWSQVAGHQDLPFIFINAKMMDHVMNPGKSTNWDQAWDMYWNHKDPAAAQAMYGLNAENVLKFWQSHGNYWQQAESELLLQNPKLAGFLTFAEEFFNPMSWAEGEAGGRVLGLGSKLMAGSQAGRALLHFASPYKEIVTKYGVGARNLIAQAGGRVQQHAYEVQQAYTEFFKDLTIPEKKEVVRLSQGATAKLPDTKNLLARSQKMRLWIKQHTTEALNDGALTQSQAYNPDVYFPMKGASQHPQYEDETLDYIGGLGGQSVGKGFNTVAKQKKFPTLDDFEAQAHLHPDWDPAEAFRTHYTAQGGNRAFSLMMDGLAKKFPGMVRGGRSLWMADYKNIGPVARPHTFETLNPAKGTVKQGLQMSGLSEIYKQQITNPKLDDYWIAPELRQWLEKGRGMMRGTSDMKKTGWNTFNTAMRQATMYNPTYHPFWNIATNASATGDNVVQWMNNYAKVVSHQIMATFGFMGTEVGKVGGVRGAIENAIVGGSQKYAQDVADAAAAGAHANYGMGTTFFNADDPATIRTMPWDKKGVFSGKNWDKAMTAITDWNQHMTFGQRGEAIFSTQLYKKFLKRGMTEEDAVWATREALGNYQNVDPNSIQSRLLFFYPWLKTNLPFWMKTFITKPRYITAPHEGFERERELSHDPNAFSATYAEPDTRAYLGQEGGDNLYYSIPLPDKDFGHIERALSPDTPFEDRVGQISSLVSSRMLPGFNIAMDTIATAQGKAGAEPGDYRGYEVMWNTNAPEGTKWSQWAQTTLGRIIPIPAPYLERQMIRDGFHLDRLAQYAMELGGAGTFTHSKSEEYSRQAHHSERRLSNAMGKIYKRQNGPTPMSPDELKDRIQHDYDTLYVKPQKALQKRMESESGVNIDAINRQKDQEQAKDAGSPPEGWHADGSQGVPAGWTKAQ